MACPYELVQQGPLRISEAYVLRTGSVAREYPSSAGLGEAGLEDNSLRGLVHQLHLDTAGVSFIHAGG